MDLSRIVLSLPLRAEFVSIVRLTGSGIASRAGFDYDAVEDIKVCLSEACNSLLNDKKKKGISWETGVVIEFFVSGEKLTIKFAVEDAGDWEPSVETEGEDDYGLMIARALMDEFETNPEDGYIVSMMKNIEEID